MTSTVKEASPELYEQLLRNLEVLREKKKKKERYRAAVIDPADWLAHFPHPPPKIP